MKLYLRLVVLVVIIVIVTVLAYFLRRASAPESAIITKEKNNLTQSIDKSRMEKDAIYAVSTGNKLRFLDYRLAIAYNKENKPEAAKSILEKLIAEESRNDPENSRRSRSYLKEADYLETLRESCELMHDEAGVKRAVDLRNRLTAKADAAKKKERQDEGKSVGIGGE
jgi:uncharacterized membrane protein YvbJ